MPHVQSNIFLCKTSDSKNIYCNVLISVNVHTNHIFLLLINFYSQNIHTGRKNTKLFRGNFNSKSNTIQSSRVPNNNFFYSKWHHFCLIPFLSSFVKLLKSLTIERKNIKLNEAPWSFVEFAFIRCVTKIKNCSGFMRVHRILKVWSLLTTKIIIYSK